MQTKAKISVAETFTQKTKNSINENIPTTTCLLNILPFKFLFNLFSYIKYKTFFFKHNRKNYKKLILT